MSASVSSLSFAQFREANIARCEDAFHPISEWSATDWATAVAGEVGEMCNLIKKIRRGDPVPIDDVAREMGDIVAYLDLLAVRMGIDLGWWTALKFNEVSVRVGSDVRLMP